MSTQEKHCASYHRLFRAPYFPDAMKDVTAIDPAEVRPAAAGLPDPAVRQIWGIVKDLYRTGMHPGVAFCLRRRGKLLLNRTLGYAGGLLPEEDREPTPLGLDTPICLFSASKAVTAMVAHKLAEEGHIDLLNPISYYIPGFAQKGKGHITILQLLSHRAGVPLLQGEHPPEALIDTERMLNTVCATEPTCAEGRITQYHALTSGFIIGELVRVTTGQSIRGFVDDTFCRPMGMRYFNYGLAEEDLDRAAVNYVTGLAPGRAIDRVLGRILGSVPDVATVLTNDERFKRAVIPSANLYATAEEACRFFQMMVDNGAWQGRQILDPMTVFHATRESGKAGLDQLLKLPLRYSNGMMLGGSPLGMYGANTHYAFGHAGYSNVFCWGDPERELSAAILTTGKPLIGPQILQIQRLLYAISRLCKPVREFKEHELLYGDARYQARSS
jgi:CubicO group peptidase (beta-lactamase class C family)